MSTFATRLEVVCGGVSGVRVDTWVESGTDVTPFYDSLLGKLMVHGSSRADAAAKMSAALADTVLGGIPSNLEYLRTIIASEGFHSGKSFWVQQSIIMTKENSHSASIPGWLTQQGAAFPLAGLALQHEMAVCGDAPATCGALYKLLHVNAGATTTKFLESLPFSPKAIEVVSPGMNTTIQARLQPAPWSHSANFKRTGFQACRC